MSRVNVQRWIAPLYIDLPITVQCIVTVIILIFDYT